MRDLEYIDERLGVSNLHPQTHIHTHTHTHTHTKKNKDLNPRPYRAADPI